AIVEHSGLENSERVQQTKNFIVTTHSLQVPPDTMGRETLMWFLFRGGIRASSAQSAKSKISKALSTLGRVRNDHGSHSDEQVFGCNIRFFFFLELSHECWRVECIR